MADKTDSPAWWQNGDWCWCGLLRDMANVVDESSTEYADQNAEGLRDLADRLTAQWGPDCLGCKQKSDAEAVADAVMNGGA